MGLANRVQRQHIADDGHINSMVRDAVELGVPPEDALVMASLASAAAPVRSGTATVSTPRLTT